MGILRTCLRAVSSFAVFVTSSRVSCVSASPNGRRSQNLLPRAFLQGTTNFRVGRDGSSELDAGFIGYPLYLSADSVHVLVISPVNLIVVTTGIQ